MWENRRKNLKRFLDNSRNGKYQEGRKIFFSSNIRRFPKYDLKIPCGFVWLTQTEVKLCVVVSTWPPRNSNRSGASDGIFPSKWTISDHSFPNYKKYFDNFSILSSFVADKLRRPRILGPARSNLSLVPEGEEEEEDVELEGDQESSAHSSSPSSVVGPVAYLSCEVVSLGKATQVRINVKKNPF